MRSPRDVIIPTPLTLVQRTAQFVSTLAWDELSPDARARLPLLVLDVMGCMAAGHRLGAHRNFVDTIARAGGEAESALWLRGERVPAPQAALANGTVAHHVEMDDGNPRASLHGGVTIIPAALALAETRNVSGKELLAAISAGYSAAVACGRVVLPGVGRHRLHPPGMIGAFGAAAASARILGLEADRTAHALGLVGLLLPFAPFEPFTKGAPVKDLYGGWPAFVGVTAAQLAGDGLTGPMDIFEATEDGLGTFLLHEGAASEVLPDPDEPLYVQFKPFATCRSVQPALTALEALLPIDPRAVDRVVVETYPFAVGLSQDSDPSTAIGAKTSIPFCIATYLIDAAVMPEAFTPAAIGQPLRRALANRVEVRVAGDMIEPVVRGARVRVTLAGGKVLTASTGAARWGAEIPATEADLRAKFRRLAGPGSRAVETAIDELPSAHSVQSLIEALSRDLEP